MKKLFILIPAFICLTFANVNAQKTNISNEEIQMIHSEIQLEKKAVFVENMQLKPEHSEAFWAIYADYEKEMSNYSLDVIKNLIAFAELEKAKLSADQLDEVAKNYFKKEKNILKIQERYFKRIQKEINVYVAVRFFQIENVVDTQLRIAQGVNTPLVKE
ncbi:hypothetical protein [Persicobacter psychrovividus]|uniref:Transcriptional regulator n=1 Tax=Persicobacter psychrovividus TaxID=387638 RepID=A0ABM7VL23_9BACT|nr:hypothetical protein PEPS_39710 [Persicobacter psychrovividus]